MNLIEAIQNEQKRVRELKAIYDTIPTGKIGSTLMGLSLAKADKAIADGDAVAMLVCLKDLQGFEE